MFDFSEKLKELRQNAGLTQVGLAEKSGVPLRTIHQYEQGNREPALSRAGALADALGVTVDALRSGGVEKHIAGAKSNKDKRRIRARTKH